MAVSDTGSDFQNRRRLLQMEMLYEVGVALSQSLEPTYVAQEALQRALVMVDARPPAGRRRRRVVPGGGLRKTQCARPGAGSDVGPFGEDDEALLRSFAYQAGAGLDNARLHSDLEQAYDELQAA